MKVLIGVIGRFSIQFNWKGLESAPIWCVELNAFPKVEELSGMNGDAAALRMRGKAGGYE